MPTSTVEDYLKCILLEEEKDPDQMVSMGQISTALAVAPGTVTSMVKALANSNLVTYEPYTGVKLTDPGRELALHVLRRHRLAELFLVKVMGMDWSEVHDEAELLEHAVSDRIIERMDEMLGFPDVDPHGDPIPSAGGEVAEPEAMNLLLCPLEESFQVTRVTDQDTRFLQLVEREGLKPGSTLKVLSRSEPADTIVVRRGDGKELNLGFRAASKILVAEG
jgi:DtxR family Mn-dependent transcriptional regulator